MTIKTDFYFLDGISSSSTVVEEVINSEIIENYYADPNTSGGVQSVNSKTGPNVSLTAADIPETSSKIWFTPSLKDAYDGAVNGKVDKISGKGLSSNDFTNSDKNKLDSLSNYTGFRGAQPTLAAVKSAYPTASSADWAIITNPSGNAFFAIYDPDISDWIDAGQSPTIPGTNLSYSISGNTLTITSDTGTDITIPLATGSAAGLMSLEDKAKIDSITAIFTSSLKSGYDGHLTNTSNPHGVTAAQIGAHTILNATITVPTLTGTTSETSVGYIAVSGGILTTGMSYALESYLARVAGASSMVARIRVSNSATPASITAETLLATLNIGAAHIGNPLVRRNIKILSASSTRICAVGTSLNEDNAAVAAALSDLNIDYTAVIYYHLTVQPISSGDSISPYKFKLIF